MMDKVSVRQRQIDEATAMINLNSDLQLDWKFLIYDHIGENILAPLFTIEDLENLNVTSHLPLHRKRDSVPDVSAVYFVLPTEENIKRICQDLSDHLYDSYYLNFISPITRSKLEQIADAALLSDSAKCVKKVYDQYLNFIALEDDFFILREKDKNRISFQAISSILDPDTSEVIELIVESLFSVLVALNIIPIIRCPPGGAAQAVADQLTKKIRETLRDSRNNLFGNKDSKTGTSSALSLSTISRPLLCIVDRTIDMSTPLHHTWTYQALIHDLFNTELNKVSIVGENGSSKTKVQTFDLNPKDKFWRDQRGKPFPQVADAIQLELDEYKRRENEVKSPIDLNSPICPGSSTDESAILAESTAKLTNTMSSLQQLLENKRVIGNHTTIAHAVLDEIKRRKLDNFFEVEEKLMNRNLPDKSMDEIFADPEYGQPSDKYRLFLISYVCDNPKMRDDEAEKYISMLESLGCKRGAFDYVKRWKTFSKVSVANLQSNLEYSGGYSNTASMSLKLLSQGSQFVMEGVKNLVLKDRYLPLTKIVDGLMDTSSRVSQEATNYTYFDPKPQKDNEVQRKKTFEDAIVFVVGGGNYIEYQNLVDYCKSKSKSLNSIGPRNIIYGSTDLMNANQFLQQLEQLGEVS